MQKQSFCMYGALAQVPNPAHQVLNMKEVWDSGTKWRLVVRLQDVTIA